MMIMEKINEIGNLKLNSSEHVSYHTSVHNFVLTIGADNINAQELITPYKAAIDAEQELIKRSPASSLTTEKNLADKQRDDYSSYLLSKINNTQRSHKDEERAIYQVLAPIVNPYKGMSSLPKNQKSTHIIGLLNHLREPGLAPQINKLNLKADIDALEVANNKFIQLEEQSVSSKLEYADTIAKRSKTDELYRSLVDKANATAILQPSEKVQQFISNINNLIRQTNTLYNLRTAQSQPAEKPKNETDNAGA